MIGISRMLLSVTFSRLRIITSEFYYRESRIHNTHCYAVNESSLYDESEISLWEKKMPQIFVVFLASIHFKLHSTSNMQSYSKRINQKKKLKKKNQNKNTKNFYSTASRSSKSRQRRRKQFVFLIKQANFIIQPTITQPLINISSKVNIFDAHYECKCYQTANLFKE